MVDTDNEPGPGSSLRSALDYASRGLLIHPVHSVRDGICICPLPACSSPGKHPCLSNGVRGASCDEATVHAFWATFPEANVAIATGPESNLVVIDVDGPKGVADLLELEAKLGTLPPTPIASTGGGGTHHYFKYPTGSAIGSPVGIGGKKIDVRGTGGYVVAPPSIHASGIPYAWLVSPDQVAPAELPANWLRWINEETGGRSRRMISGQADLATAPGVGEGSRHATATRLIGIALGKGLNPIEVRVQALDWARRCEPPFPEEETLRIVADLAAKDACREADLAAEVANPDGWEVPIPFGEAELPAFPTEVLPDSIGDFVRAIAIATQTPPDLAAMLALPVVAAACAKRHEVRINAGYAEPLNIFTAVSLGPGNRKSSVYSQLVLPLMRYEESRNRNFKLEYAVAKQRLEAEEGRLKDLNGRLARAKEEAERAQLARQAEEQAARVAEMRMPSPPRLVADNATPERLAGLMAENGGRIAVMSPEGEIFEQIAGRYSGRANLDVLLKGHAGDDIRVDRMGRPSELIVAPALTVGVAVQPQVIADLFDKPGFRGKGLIARILFAMPTSLVGRRDVDAPPVPDEVRERYHRTIASLLS